MEITDKNRPVTFKLPDNDEVSLVPWEYIIDRLTVDLEPIIMQLEMTNTALQKIDNKLSDWMKTEEEVS